MMTLTWLPSIEASRTIEEPVLLRRVALADVTVEVPDRDPDAEATLKLGDVVVVEKGAMRPVTEEEREAMTAAVRRPEVDIRLDLGLGQASTEIFFADMSHEYITINAEYHT